MEPMLIIVVAALFFVTGVCVYYWRQESHWRREFERVTASREDLQAAFVKYDIEQQSRIADLRSRIDVLEPYSVIPDAEATASRIIADAENAARRTAEEALEKFREKETLTRTISALRNVIEGYGTTYVVPDYELLDALGEEFSADAAGRALRDSIKKAREMARLGWASACDYVEPDRRDTAKAFVVDAFVGKVETILSGVKQDNFGTMKQKIEDAYQLVNHLGRAFRNARITPAFLEAQVEILRWTVAALELKRRDKEEQRAIKERIREEERASREYAKTMKEAAKEEETARKALEKARAELEAASDAQKAKYEAKLIELEARLRAAEEKGQRALSMAQQTRAGNVYIISNVGSFGEDVLKVGMTRRLEPMDRIRELGDASVPFEFDVHAMIRSEDAPTLERELHKRLLRRQINKVNARKEFFRVSVNEVRKLIEDLGLHAVWTMTADARQWRESQALELKLRSDEAAAQAWEQQQIREHDRSLAAQLADEDLEEVA